MEISVLRIFKYLLYDTHRFKHFKNHWIKNHQVDYDDFCKGINQLTRPEFPISEKLVDLPFTVFDIEATGFFPRIGDEVISIGAVKMTINDIELTKQFYEVVCPIKPPSNDIKSLIGMTQEQINKGTSFPESLLDFLSFVDQSIIVAHPASFDVPFLQEMAKRWSMPIGDMPYIDCHELAQYLYPNEKNTLDHLVKRFGIAQKERHHALNDAIMTAEVFQILMEELKQRGITTLQEYQEAMNIK